MPSDTFRRLYKKALVREHCILGEIERIWNSEMSMTFPEAARMSRQLLQIEDDYLRDLEIVALRHRMQMRAPLRGKGCPVCGSASCQGAMNEFGNIPTGIALLKAIMQGLLPPLQPPSE